METVPKLISKREVAARLGCCVRTVDRRVRDGTLSAPIVINRLHFWAETRADLDRKRLIERAATRHAYVAVLP
jgi:hypothetical protein